MTAIPRAQRLPSVAETAATYGLALLATAFFALPLVWIVLSSLKSEADVSAFPPKWIFTPTAANYLELFTKLKAGPAMLNSFFIVTIATLLAMLMGTMAAYALARFSFKGKETFALELLSIRMLPPIVSVIPLSSSPAAWACLTRHGCLSPSTP